MKLSPLTPIGTAAVLIALCVAWEGQAPSTRATEDAPLAPAVLSTLPQPDLITETNLATPAVAAPVQLSAPLQEIVKLAQSGVGDDVILAYIESSAIAFNPTPEEILYLTDIGISDVVITALVNHKSAQPPAAWLPAPGAPVQPAPLGAAPEPVSYPEPTYNPEPALTTADAYPQPAEVEYPAAPIDDGSYFYDSLAPYGSWVMVNDSGWCWQPTVAVLHHGWMPYCDHGRWIYTDCGWYWQSDYSWGWAPFHYGRWFHHPVRGWCWKPDSVWAPAWVAWRYSDAHCGWAPLPPGAHYRPGLGFTYYGAHVGAGFGFGLGQDCWTFVPAQRFHDSNLSRYCLSRGEVGRLYHHTRLESEYAADRHGTIINHGIRGEHLPALARSEVPKVSVRETPAGAAGRVAPDRFHQEGAQLVLYRPKLISPPAGTARGSGQTWQTPRTIGSRPSSPGIATPGSPQPDPRPIKALGQDHSNPGGSSKPLDNPQVTIISRERATPNPVAPAPRLYQGSPGGTWTPNRIAETSPNQTFQRWTPTPPQPGPSASEVYRQEVPKAATSPASRNNTPGSFSVPNYSLPTRRFDSPTAAPSYSAPSAPNSYAPNRPGQTYSAPSVPSYAAPSRPAQTYSAPVVQPRPSAPAMAPSRPAPQPAPVPSQTSRRAN